MTYSHTILITAPGGNIGSELVPLLASTNNKLILPTSNANRLQSKLPSSITTSPNVVVEEGSIRDPYWLESILTKHKIDVVFLCLTGTDELLTTLNFFDSMQRAGGVKQVIYLSGCGDYTSPEGIKYIMENCSAMHVVVKSTIELKIRYGNFPWATTVLGPTLFFGNDLRSKKSILQDGLFDEPLGAGGVSRVATSDIALAVRNAIADPAKYDGKKIMLGSRKMYTAEEIAALWGAATGREVKALAGDDESLLKFEGHVMKDFGMGADWARDMRLMYDTLGMGFGMSEEEYLEQVELLEKEAEDYPAWVKRVGEGWKN